VRLKSISGEDLEGSGKARVQSILISAGRSDSAIERITSRLGMESRITAVSWEFIDRIDE